MTPEYILRKSLCRRAHCSQADMETRARRIEDMTYASEYAEPGYTQPSKGILFANWNYFSNKVADVLERYGFAVEWEDEWTVCEGCNRAVRTSPNSYSWQPSFAIENDCEIFCIDCLKQNPTSYLEGLENNTKTAVNTDIDPAEHGYTKLQGDYESGFHPGQNDDPKEIYKKFRALGHTRPLLFKVDGVGQFDMSFSIYEKNEEEN